MYDPPLDARDFPRAYRASPERSCHGSFHLRFLRIRVSFAGRTVAFPASIEERRAWVNVKRRAGSLFRKNKERKTKGKEEGRGKITNVSKKTAYTRAVGHR